MASFTKRLLGFRGIVRRTHVVQYTREVNSIHYNPRAFGGRTLGRFLTGAGGRKFNNDHTSNSAHPRTSMNS